MTDIDKLLAKHFTGEARQEEQLLVDTFKNNNPEEYNRLKSLWYNQSIRTFKPNTSKALHKVKDKVKGHKKQEPKLLKRAIIVLALFSVLALGAYYFLNLKGKTITQIEHMAQLKNEKITFEDGSIVYLNKNAKINYPETFGPNSREISLQGEAFFEVAKDPNKPFIIHTKHSNVQVLGTSFNINTETEQTTVSVKTGKVKVQSQFTNDSAILLANQSAEINNKKLEVTKEEQSNYLAWKTGVFNFEETPIHEVVAELNTFYENKISLSTSSSNCVLSSDFNNIKLTEILQIIELSCDLKLTSKNGSYELQ